MSDPSTLGQIGLGTSIAGGITQTAGALFSGGAQSSYYNYRAGISQLNAMIDLQNANYAKQAGEIKATQYGMAAQQRMGQIKAAQASSGIDVNSGSAVDVRKSQDVVSHMDQDMIRSNAAKVAYDYTNAAMGHMAEASANQSAAAMAKKAGYLNAASSIIGTAGSVAGKWYQGQSLGMFGSNGVIGLSAGPDPLTEWSYGR